MNSFYKKVLFGLFVVALLSGCSEQGITLDTAIKNGSNAIVKGMSKDRVNKIIKKEPDSVERIGDIELWTYEGVITNEDTEEKRYKNLTIRFNKNVVDYVGYFGCKLPKIEE